MTARQVEQASHRLDELGTQTVEDIALAVLAIVLALGATQVSPALAVPFLLGAIGVGILGVRALVRRTLLVEDLAADGDAYTIPAVRRYGSRAASLEGRRLLAGSIRVAQVGSTVEVEQRLAAVRSELDELVAALEDERVHLDPPVFVALERWLNDPLDSFRNPSIPAVELRSRLRRILLDVQQTPVAP